MVDVNGIINAAVGTGTAALAEMAALQTAAFLNRPCGLAFRSNGNLYMPII